MNMVMNEQQRMREREEKIVQRHLFGVAPPSDAAENAAVMEDAGKAFEFFRTRSSLSPAIEENKELLRDKYAEAKTLGERANSSRSTITYLKNSIESLRRERALQGSGEGKDENEEAPQESEQEATHRRAIEQEKLIYKESFERLRVLKPEIEHIRKILEKGRSSLQSQFDQWYNSLLGRDGKVLTGSQAANTSSSMYSGATTRASNNSTLSSIQNESGRGGGQNAWGTPPRNDKGGGGNGNVGGGNSDSPGRAEAKGGEEVNEDIAAFYQAKEEMLKRRAAR
jgi:hypothetical protein